MSLISITIWPNVTKHSRVDSHLFTDFFVDIISRLSIYYSFLRYGNSRSAYSLLYIIGCHVLSSWSRLNCGKPSSWLKSMTVSSFSFYALDFSILMSFWLKGKTPRRHFAICAWLTLCLSGFSWRKNGCILVSDCYLLINALFIID